MKGMAHFMTGVALATFFPEVVELATDGSLLPVIGGIGGILPDTLDFKFARYFEIYDLEIEPELEPNPGAIADALVESMTRAYKSKSSQNIMLRTLRLGADLWREYAVHFDPDAGTVAVSIGPLVNTGQVPYPGTAPDGGQGEARRQLDFPLAHTYSQEYRINVFTGPSFRFVREQDELAVHFLDWHRRWSHSLVLALGIGLVLGLLFGKWVGMLFALGFAAHILEDQLGYMGSNLFWPVTHRRQPGLKLIHSGDATPNFLTVWVSMALILFNLDRFSTQPYLASAAYLLLVLGIPLLVFGIPYLWRKVKPGLLKFSEAFMEQADIVSEVESGDTFR
ncbi:MAG: metal-dependent hydrolase [Anaerolineae bacterium]|nr:metal-dependent hydrolase [Anaerolineae bacterium]